MAMVPIANYYTNKQRGRCAVVFILGSCPWSGTVEHLPGEHSKTNVRHVFLNMVVFEGKFDGFCKRYARSFLRFSVNYWQNLCKLISVVVFISIWKSYPSPKWQRESPTSLYISNVPHLYIYTHICIISRKCIYTLVHIYICILYLTWYSISYSIKYCFI